MIRLRAANDAKAEVAALMQAYLAEMAEFTGAEPDADGIWHDRYFDLYWTETTRWPFLIADGDQTVGFALVRLDGEAMQVAEFYIRPGHRRVGKGAAAAQMLFDQFPGTWHVAQLSKNYAAQMFWETLISTYSAGAFRTLGSADKRWQKFRNDGGLDER